ncbi:anti-dorsalizing morphogenic protein isoform X1 [Stegostoma tigrinum]|uniref:anti-dorsalizing morphogenic protein isoform X1 n=1 Tax=Stegostoma tigrinum TaxID=3053191 RepID=UPI00202AD331|nr:anti-dorsalizing morphogenic protein isoform X1 [Stegostoma tigrinum]
MCSRLGASLLLLLIFLRPNCAASLPGHNQQVRSQALKRLLEVFGMVDAPQSPHRVRQPPQYMLDLYNAVADVDGVTKQPDLLVGNTVRSFLDRSRSQQLQFFFNLSSVAKSETILSAELHLFKLRGRLFRDTLHHRQHFCQVSVYQILDSSNTSTAEGQRLLSSRVLAVHDSTWEVFTITQAVYTWTHDKKSNKGLMVIVQTLAGQQTNNHFVRFATARDHHSSKQPMLVLFTDEERRGITTSSSLKDMGTENPFISHRILQNKASQNRNTRSLHFQGCQRHHLYVDFEEIGWSGWIISPRGYNAYHCKGACVFPLGKNMRPTNHATVQSIINALKLANDVASPCCIPDKLFSINLLYFDDDENVVLKQYDDMVAGSCGCH